MANRVYFFLTHPVLCDFYLTFERKDFVESYTKVMLQPYTSHTKNTEKS